MIRSIINGFCMALADSVPGVSGGTIAFIMGFYDQFIGSIHDLAFRGMEEKKRAFFYLVKLGIGWIIGMISAVLVLSAVFESHIYVISSLFIGFIVCAIPVIIQEEKECIVGHYKNLIFLVIGAAVVALITYFNSSNQTVASDLSHLTIGSGIYLFVVGMIAISAMFLPGISGSTLLLIFGLYVPVIHAIKELLHFNFTYLPAIIVFGIGIVTGALTVVKGIKVCLDKFRSQMVYAILGMMIGSLYAIVMGPTTLEVSQPAMNFESFHFIACLIGVGLIILLQVVREKKEA